MNNLITVSSWCTCI